MMVHDQSQEGIVLYAFVLPFIRGLEGDQPGDVGLYAGDAGAKFNMVSILGKT